jgi:Phytanoyl-CoA dioxygenase (PhyH)
LLSNVVGRDAGGFQCLPDVYQNLQTWVTEHAQREDFDFFNPGLNDRKTLQIEGNAGDLILWSTRLPHGPAPNHSTKPRIAAFVSMGPPLDSPELRAQMKEWWSNKQAPVYWRGLPGQLEIEPGPPAKLTKLGMN